MSERAIFTEALDWETPEDRAAYLDAACAGDPALRARVEALLRSHEQAGEFPGKLAPQRLAEELAARGPDDTRTGPGDAGAAGGLDFLDPPDKPGSIGRLGHYEVREVVGRGGMGVVLRAFDEQLHRVVAIKVMAPQLATSATARRRFVREARAQAAVAHDHVVTIHAVDESGPLPYIVMQFVAGQSLQDRLDRAGPLQLYEVLRIGMQAASGLAAAHAQGLVHRDVKPANILLENGVERVKLTDFGLARAADDASLTQSGLIAGTPQYMSPEQAEGRPVDHRSDLFSLGSVLYAACAGRPPFRAGTSMGVLKRVCEESPTPIRQVNPETPDWLAELIGRLHAKDPVGRFQSAAEVAELLGRHLAHVQHPPAVPLPAAANAAERTPAPARPPRRGRRWAAAACVLVAVLAALGSAEATGVTKVRATVIRIFTPDGVVVVETDDPAVRVTFEGDGGLVITGAGLEEIRLRPGSYRVQADRDGKPVPLDKNLVEVTRGGRKIVKVKLETPTTPASAKAAKRAFVLLDGKGIAERKFDTLAGAIQGASDGDTIEVRGNGPFASEPISIGRTPLTIRAGAGFRPVIKEGSKGIERVPLLATNAPLVLEGLHFQADFPEGQHRPFQTNTAPLRAANCRFDGGIWMTQPPVCVFRNCQFHIGHGSSACCAQQINSGARIQFENCLSWCNGHAIHLFYAIDATDDVSIQIRRSTFASKSAPLALSLNCAKPAGMDGPKAMKPLRLEVSRSVFDSSGILAFGQLQGFTKKAGVLPPAEADAMLLRLIEWRGEWNLFAAGSNSVHWYVNFMAQPPRGPKGLDEWKKFSGSREADSRDGRARFHGGSLLARAKLEQLTPDDFRLRPDSAGYRDGPGGKDLGADVDLVGPGEAYERWKKTPDYRQWLKDTNPVK